MSGRGRGCLTGRKLISSVISLSVNVSNASEKTCKEKLDG